MQTNFTSDVSTVDRWVDSNGNGLPDIGGSVTLATLSGAHVVRGDLGSAGTLYLVDRLGGRVFRMADTDGDHAPDAGSETVFVAPGGVLGSTSIVVRVHAAQVVSAEATLLRDEIGEPTAFAIGRKVVVLSDTNGDGVADSSSPASSAPAEDHRILHPLWEGAGSVGVVTSSTAALRIETTETPPVTLATLTGGGGVNQTVILSRNLQVDETIRLVDVTTGAVLDEGTAKSNADAHFSGLALTSASAIPSEGDVLGIYGERVVGNEVVRCSKVPEPGPADWVVASIDSSSSSDLQILIPELGLSSNTQVLVEVTTGAGRSFRWKCLVKPD